MVCFNNLGLNHLRPWVSERVNLSFRLFKRSLGYTELYTFGYLVDLPNFLCVNFNFKKSELSKIREVPFQ